MEKQKIIIAINDHLFKIASLIRELAIEESKPVPKSAQGGVVEDSEKCCGRCNGIDDICIADRAPSPIVGEKGREFIVGWDGPVNAKAVSPSVGFHWKPNEDSPTVNPCPNIPPNLGPVRCVDLPKRD